MKKGLGVLDIHTVSEEKGKDKSLQAGKDQKRNHRDKKEQKRANNSKI